MKLCDVITSLTEKRTETEIRSFPLSISTNHNTARKNSFPLTRDEPERKRKIDQYEFDGNRERKEFKTFTCRPIFAEA